MEIVRYANIQYLSILGEAPVYSDKVYRLSKCLLMADVNGGKVILNGLTRAVVFLTDEDFTELGDINKYSFLYKAYFLVPEEFDELGAIDDIRKRLTIPIDSLYLEQSNGWTILTTYGCNARCEYCYENHVTKKTHMTKETALKVAEYINNKSPLDPINLHWFGGEPLFNMKAIDTITGYLRDNGRTFKSTITTNGYLFDAKIVSKAKHSWGLTDVQITLDGTETIYNKTKNFIYKNTNAFKTVFKNIGLLLNAGIKVMIRLNVSDENKEDLYELVNQLYDAFGVTSGLEIYCWPLFMTEDVIVKPVEGEQVIYEWINKIEDRIMQCGFPFGKMIKDVIATYQCMADGGDSILVSPEGKLGTCEHFISTNFWGDVYDLSKKDYNELNKWRKYEPRIPECDICPIYAECIRPSECMEMKRCNELIREHKIKQYKEGLIDFYLEYNRRSKNSSILNVNEE